jgi:predicted aldo/keto reductase-like oxidoreductase
MPAWDIVRSRDDAARIFDEQLIRCKTSYFDFYLAHNLNTDNMGSLKNFIYNFLRKKKEEGLIRRLGFSFHDHSDPLKMMIENYEWDFAQAQINYLDWDTADAKSHYEILTEKKLPVIIMEPVKGGTLAKPNEKALALLKNADPAASAASWALRFAASLPNAMTVLSGMSDLEQVEENL